MDKRLSRGDLVEAWLAAQEGAIFYLDTDPDTPVHVRRDCPRLGSPVIILTVKDGLLVDGQGFFFRGNVICNCCVKDICKSS